MSPTTEALEERIKGHDVRIDSLEGSAKEQAAQGTQLLVELKVLQMRVTVYAGVIAAVVSFAIKQIG